MEKLRLAVSELEVETFEACETAEPRGTVAAAEGTVTCLYPQCGGTVMVNETCYSGCTNEVCEPTFVC